MPNNKLLFYRSKRNMNKGIKEIRKDEKEKGKRRKKKEERRRREGGEKEERRKLYNIAI
jgi:hypothetical protein